jgi:hypothetical protein
MVYKSKSKVIDLHYSNMCQIIPLLYQSIKGHLSINRHKKPRNKNKSGSKPKFSNMKAKDI